MKLLLFLVAAATANLCADTLPCTDCLASSACYYYEIEGNAKFCSEKEDLPHLQKFLSASKCPHAEAGKKSEFSMVKLGSAPKPSPESVRPKVHLDKDVITTTPTTTMSSTSVLFEDGVELGSAEESLDDHDTIISIPPPTTITPEEEDIKITGSLNDHDSLVPKIHALVTNGNSTVTLRTSAQEL